MNETASLPQFTDLLRHVRGTLCRPDALDPEQTPMTQTVVVRSRRPCGLHFEVQGPRRVRASAVWAWEERRILFYDSQGRRFAVTTLAEAPDTARLGNLKSGETPAA